MTSREKITNIEHQVQALMIGEQLDFLCPFCNQVTIQGQMLCCAEASEVVNAIMDHLEHLERTEIIDQIMDNLSGMPTLN